MAVRKCWIQVKSYFNFAVLKTEMLFFGTNPQNCWEIELVFDCGSNWYQKLVAQKISILEKNLSSNCI